MTVGRRALVDSQVDRAREILRRMNEVLADESGEPDILRRVAEALQSFQTRNDEQRSAPFEVHIRGELSNRTLPVTDISTVRSLPQPPTCTVRERSSVATVAPRLPARVRPPC